MIHDIVIISAGKHAREVCCLAEHAIAAGQPWRLKGFLDDRPQALAGFNYPVPVLGSVEAYRPASSDLFLCAIGDPAQKRKYAEMILHKGGKLATLVHPTASVGRNVTLEDGVIIAPMAVLTADLKIGRGAYVGSHVTCSHDNTIGDWCHISGGCTLAGGVTLEDESFLGVHATLIPGVRIGRRALVGAGSVVIRHVNPGIKVVGNPAAPIGTVDE